MQTQTPYSVPSTNTRGEKAAQENPVVRGLRGFADDDADGLILGAEVGGFVAEHGATDRNTPQWGMLDVSPFDEGDVAFRVPELGRSSPEATGAQQALAVELAFWQLVEPSGDAAELQEYLDAYPDGAFAELARRELRRRAPSSATYWR